MSLKMNARDRVSTTDSNDDSEIDFVSEVSHDDSLEFSQTQEESVSKDRKETWHWHPVNYSVGKTFLLSILQQESGPSFAKWTCNSIPSSCVLFAYHSLSGMVCKRTNAEGRCVYESYWKEIDDVEMKKFIGLTILIGVCKSNNENVLQL